MSESVIQLPRVGWRLLACENGAFPDCIIVVVVSGAPSVGMSLSTGRWEDVSRLNLVVVVFRRMP